MLRLKIVGYGLLIFLLFNFILKFCTNTSDNENNTNIEYSNNQSEIDENPQNANQDMSNIDKNENNPNLSGDWSLNNDEYKRQKSVSVKCYRNESDEYSRARARIIIKGVKMENNDKIYVWNVYEPEQNYLFLTTEQLASTFTINIFVNINGENKEFIYDYPQDTNMILTQELLEAFLKGTEGAIKFNGNPNYYKFSLNGINGALDWLLE